MLVQSPVGARGLRQLLGRDAVLALAIVASGFVLQLPFFLHGVNLSDEGAILEIADELLRGRRLYADVQYPAFPGVLLVTAALFRLFGSSFATARIFAAGVFAGTVGVMFLMARWSLSRCAAVAVALLCLVYRVWAYPHWHMVSYSSLGVALVLAAGWIVGDAFEPRGHWRYGLAGLVAGAAVLAKQDIGPVGVGVLGLAVLTAAPIRFTSRMR